MDKYIARGMSVCDKSISSETSVSLLFKQPSIPRKSILFILDEPRLYTLYPIQQHKAASSCWFFFYIAVQNCHVVTRPIKGDEMDQHVLFYCEKLLRDTEFS